MPLRVWCGTLRTQRGKFRRKGSSVWLELGYWVSPGKMGCSPAHPWTSSISPGSCAHSGKRTQRHKGGGRGAPTSLFAKQYSTATRKPCSGERTPSMSLQRWAGLPRGFGPTDRRRQAGVCDAVPLCGMQPIQTRRWAGRCFHPRNSNQVAQILHRKQLNSVACIHKAEVHG